MTLSLKRWLQVALNKQVKTKNPRKKMGKLYHLTSKSKKMISNFFKGSIKTQNSPHNGMLWIYYFQLKSEFSFISEDHLLPPWCCLKQYFHVCAILTKLWNSYRKIVYFVQFIPCSISLFLTLFLGSNVVQS